MIYLASPYSALASQALSEREAAALRHHRYCLTMAAQKLLFEAGYPVFATIVHTHITARVYGLPTDAQFWMKYNHHMIDLSRAVFVLQLDGWQSSIGVQDEIEYANRIDRLVYPIEVNEYAGSGNIGFSLPHIPELQTLKRLKETRIEERYITSVITPITVG